MREACPELRPEPGKEVDCDKIKDCINGFIDKVEC
jgi:hypothetical protein